MSNPEPTVLLEGILFGEGPRWHEHRLWFSDMWGGKVMSVDLDGNTQHVAHFDHPSGLGFMPDGSLLVSVMHERRIYRIASGETTVHADLTKIASELTNDMVVTYEGYAYVGTDLKNVALVEPDGKARLVAEGMRGPNGMAITPDGQTLVVNETRGEAIRSFSIEPDGSLVSAELFAQLPDVFPDGLCLDEEGAAWIGSPPLDAEHYGDGQFLRVLPGGEITDRIETPGRWAIAPMLGGPDRRTLFMTTSSVENVTLLKQTGKTEDGRIETLRVEVPGAGLP
ncbi:MAG: SMP-30/gluconolactonase/LRE family protein [Acidimicrobiales bacterium]|nr:SMP-30/gluconolactonase/LRE family protein [Acidimicrobiales bacterium]